MRVLLVTNHYPPVLGMSSRGMAELSKALVRQGHAADVLTALQGGQPAGDAASAATPSRDL